MSKKLGAVQIPKLAGAALRLQGFVLLFSATPVFSALSLHFANFLRSGRKLGLLWFVAVCKGFVWLFSATPVFFCIYCDFANFLRWEKRGACCGFANFLRSGRKLGLFCFTKLTDFFNFDLRVFFTRFANSQVFTIFVYNFALVNCFLLCLRQVA